MGGFTSTAALSSTTGEPGDGRESLDSLESMCTASLFSWELRGSTASLLGRGVSVMSRLAENKELDFVVFSFKQDDGDALMSFKAAVGIALEACVEPLVLDWVADLEKKPRMLCCLPVEGMLELLVFFAVTGVFAGVRAGALEVSPIIAETWNKLTEMT